LKKFPQIFHRKNLRIIWSCSQCNDLCIDSDSYVCILTKCVFKNQFFFIASASRTRRPGFESGQGIRFLGKHSNAVVYKMT
jgi:hypothetical protein